MKNLSIVFVSLARCAKREARLYHLLGDRDEEEHAGQMARHYMDAARQAKQNQPLVRVL